MITRLLECAATVHQHDDLLSWLEKTLLLGYDIKNEQVLCLTRLLYKINIYRTTIYTFCFAM